MSKFTWARTGCPNAQQTRLPNTGEQMSLSVGTLSGADSKSSSETLHSCFDPHRGSVAVN